MFLYSPRVFFPPQQNTFKFRQSLDLVCLLLRLFAFGPSNVFVSMVPSLHPRIYLSPKLRLEVSPPWDPPMGLHCCYPSLFPQLVLPPPSFPPDPVGIEFSPNFFLSRRIAVSSSFLRVQELGFFLRVAHPPVGLCFSVLEIPFCNCQQISKTFRARPLL